MRFSLASIFVLATAVFTACQTSTTGPADGLTDVAKSEPAPVVSGTPAETAAANVDEHGHEDNAPRIELADAKKAFDEGNVIFIDTRSRSAFATERIKGAINIPMESFQQQVKEVPKGKPIIAYCS